MSAPDPVAISVDGDVVIARLMGEIDLANARAIGSLVAGAVPNDATGTVIDLAGTTYLDSSGVHLIFDLAERLAGRQQKLAIAVPPDARVRRVLDLVNVESVLPVADSVDGAAALVRGEG